MRQQMLAMFDLLTIRCKYSENGCEETLKISDMYLMIMKRVAGFQGEEKEGSYNIPSVVG